MYEFVPKSEYRPVRRELEEVIKRTQVYMRKKFNTAFQFKLIGSGSRHLITRVVNGNGGYDFDYNLILPAPKEGYHYLPDVVKAQFMEALKNALQRTKYSNPQDSTSAITIKVIDRSHSRIVHSCDFAIIYYDNNESNNGYYYLRNNKSQQKYEFVFRKLSENVDEKLEEILKDQDGWNGIKKEYLKLKNANNDINKRSFSLYLEAVNNIFNRIYLGDFFLR